MKERAPRNRTLSVSSDEMEALYSQSLQVSAAVSVQEIINRIIHGDILKVVEFLPDQFVDLLILDPPYNLAKNYNGTKFSSRSNDAYLEYLESWFSKLLRLLKPTASVYLCGDWKSSLPQFQLLQKYLHIRNRITWQREKGRGASANWKNSCEDIWFATVSDRYYFNLEAVKVKRRVLAPYKENGVPKDWQEDSSGKYRLTCPSNFWDDISIPYWSMPENTEHPTQKPEKLFAKLILASSRPGDVVFDPFIGSGTSAVVAKKLQRQFTGIEINRDYCCWALARLQQAETMPSIQGYQYGVFWERNTKPVK